MRKCWMLAAALLCVVNKPVVRAETPYTIAFASFAPLNAEILLANADGTGAKPFLPSPAQDWNASFSRDGRWIVFTSTRHGSADLYRARPDGSGLERLTDDPAFDDQAALAPDGRRLAFVSTRGGHTDIWTLDLQSRALTRLTRDAGGNFRSAWSPDGTWVAFSSDRDAAAPRRPNGFETIQRTALYRMRADGLGSAAADDGRRFRRQPAVLERRHKTRVLHGEPGGRHLDLRSAPAACDDADCSGRRGWRRAAHADQRAGREVVAALADGGSHRL